MSATRRNFLKGLSTVALAPVVPAFALDVHAAPKAHRIMTCNIRVALDEDEAKGVGWSVRKELCMKIIKDKKPDIVGFQEVIKVQADDVRKYFSAYELFGFDGPEMDAHTTGYHGIAKNPIMFLKDRYELLSAGTYWLSEKPLVAGSKSWDTARARHANWVRLREKKTGKEFRFVNTHLDHVSNEAKIQQAKMIVEESVQYQPEFVQLFTGDFNSKFDSNVLDPIRAAGWKESYETVHGTGEAGYTTHEFEGTNYAKGASKGRIDFIWYRGNGIRPTGAAIIKDSVKGKFPSDHYFMQADLVIE